MSGDVAVRKAKAMKTAPKPPMTNEHLVGLLIEEVKNNGAHINTQRRATITEMLSMRGVGYTVLDVAPYVIVK